MYINVAKVIFQEFMRDMLNVFRKNQDQVENLSIKFNEKEVINKFIRKFFILSYRY